MIDLTTIQAKSDQMNAADFVRPMAFKILKVDYNPKQEQPISLHLEGCDGRPYKPCKSMLRGLCKAWSMDETKWSGNVIELYCDLSVKWAGKEQGGIRISGISGITKELKFTVNLNRSQRVIHSFRVLDASQQVKSEFIVTHWSDAISKAESNEEITNLAQQVKREFGESKLNDIKDAVIKARAKFTETSND